MRVSKWFTAFAASFFALVFIRDGTAGGLVDDAAKGTKRLLRGTRRLTRKSFG